MRHSGFTLIEILVVVGLMTILLTVASVSLMTIQTRASINSLTDQLFTDIKSQQLKAMTGDTDGSGVISAYGIYFHPTGYVLFRGSAYTPSDPANFSVAVDSTITISSTFPLSQSGSVLLFTPVNGEISGYVSGSDSVTLSLSPSESKTLQFNRYGVLISQI